MESLDKKGRMESWCFVVYVLLIERAGMAGNWLLLPISQLRKKKRPTTWQDV